MGPSYGLPGQHRTSQSAFLGVVPFYAAVDTIRVKGVTTYYVLIEN